MPPQQGFDHAFDAGHHGFAGWPILGIAMFLILIGVLIWAVLRVTHTEARPVLAGGPSPRPDGALDEVRLRYARGEMTRDEFVQRFQDLGGPRTSPPVETGAAQAQAIAPMPPDDPSPGGAEPPPAA